MVRRLQSGERLDRTVLRRFAERGLQAHQALRAGTLFELPTALPSRDTRENRVLVAFVNILRRRVERSLARAKGERETRYARLNAYGRTDIALSRFIQLREEPKIAKLQEIIENAEVLLSEIRRAIRTFAVPVVAQMTPRAFFDSIDTPVFRSDPRYSLAARTMRAFLNNTAIVVEQGDSEGAKSLETIYEQWVFFQVCAAVRAAGLFCISHNSIFEPIARDRFSVDLDRNAAITFEAPDKRIVRLRYEPTILPRHAAAGHRLGLPWAVSVALDARHRVGNPPAAR